jgi:hypothetical protein
VGESTWFDKKVIANGVTTSLYYNNNTQNFVYNWNDPNNAMHYACLRIDKVNATSSGILTDTCTQSMAGTILYNINVYDGQQYTATGYLKFDQNVITDILEIYLENLTKFFQPGDKSVLFLAFLISFSMLLIGLGLSQSIPGSGAVLSNIMMCLGIVICYLLGFWAISLTSLFTLIILNIINFIIAERR